MLAGAKHIVMTLWGVNAKASTELMRLFYENIKNGLSYSEALKKAKISMIEGKSMTILTFGVGLWGVGVNKFTPL